MRAQSDTHHCIFLLITWLLLAWEVWPQWTIFMPTRAALEIWDFGQLCPFPSPKELGTESLSFHYRWSADWSVPVLGEEDRLILITNCSITSWLLALCTCSSCIRQLNIHYLNNYQNLSWFSTFHLSLEARTFVGIYNCECLKSSLRASKCGVDATLKQTDQTLEQQRQED